MDIDKAFADPKLESEGVWVSYREGSKVKVARMGNPTFQKHLDAKMRPHKRKQDRGTLSSEIETRVLCEAIAETVLLDWSGFTKDGKDFKYTPDAAAALLIQSMDFRNEISDIALVEEHFRNDETEDLAKNS